MIRLRSERSGRFMPQKCPECSEPLQDEGKDIICTGLVDPENRNVELLACRYRAHYGLHDDINYLAPVK